MSQQALESPHVSSSTEVRRRTRSFPLSRILGYVVPPLVALAFLGLAWELTVRAGHIKVYILPAPSVVLQRLFSDLGFFAYHAWITFYEAVLGFAIGSLVALALAAAMAHSLAVERSLYPLALLVKVTPVVVIAPLLVIWLGFGMAPKVLVAAYIAFFPVLVNAITGFRTVNPRAMDFLRSVNASQWEVFVALRLPSATPYLFSAFRVALPLALIGAVVGEWFSAEKGLGSVVFVAIHNLDMPTIFAAIISLALTGIVLNTLLLVIERRLLFWHESANVR